jgi:hypothetical protein
MMTPVIINVYATTGAPRAWWMGSRQFASAERKTFCLEKFRISVQQCAFFETGGANSATISDQMSGNPV